jgi:hypothetical protein
MTVRGSRIGGVRGNKARFGPQLLRVQSERLELPAPFCRSIAESLDSYTAWQPAFDRCSDKMWGQEGERDRHIDLTRTAFLTCCDLLNVGDGARR